MVDEPEQVQTAYVRLLGANERLRADPDGPIGEPAVLLLNQARQLADQLVDEATTSARDLVVAARAQQRDILRQASIHGAGQSVPRVSLDVARRTGPDDRRLADNIGDMLVYARIARVQLRVLIDALDEQVDKLGEVTETATAAAPVAESAVGAR